MPRVDIELSARGSSLFADGYQFGDQFLQQLSELLYRLLERAPPAGG
jgi:hypothetical protein